MDREIEAAAAASLGGFLKWPHTHLAAPGSACANCAAILQGPYCHQCGQLAEDFHRSLWHLAVEAVESFFHFDGRFWRTLPRLARDPGGLTRDYLEGRRAGQIPPLRLFLVALLLVFLLGGVGHKGPVKEAVLREQDGRVSVTRVKPEEAARIAGSDLQLDLGDPRRSAAVTGWLKPRLVQAASHPEQFTMVLETGAHRLAVLMLPIGAALLALLFVTQKRFYFYDHLIFTMHSLSFQGLLLSAGFLIGLVSSPLAWLVVMAGAPTHLFVHLRGAYRTAVGATLARMAVLFIGSTIAFVALLLLLVLIGLNAMAAA